MSWLFGVASGSNAESLQRYIQSDEVLRRLADAAGADVPARPWRYARTRLTRRR
jgi:hypothetical protein